MKILKKKIYYFHIKFEEFFFVFKAWDDKKYVLSAATAGIRSNWIAALVKAAGLVKNFENGSLKINEKLERDLDKPRISLNNSQYFDSNHSTSHNTYLDSGNLKILNYLFLFIKPFYIYSFCVKY